MSVMVDCERISRSGCPSEIAQWQILISSLQVLHDSSDRNSGLFARASQFNAPESSALTAGFHVTPTWDLGIGRLLALVHSIER